MSSNPTLTSNRYYYAGKELQKTGNLNWLDFGARMYDPFVGRWTAPDPLMEKYPGISPYAYCAGNPMNLVDPDGMSMDNYVFDKDGRFIRKELTTNPDKIIYQSIAGNIDISFADPDSYPLAIDEQTRLKVVSSSEITKELDLSGATDARNHGFVSGIQYLLKNSDSSKNEGKLDFVVNSQMDIVDGPFLYVTYTKSEGFVAHDAHNFGNFLWGAAANQLGVPLWIAKLGAHFNNFFDPHYNHKLDSTDDQFSITIGYHWKP